MSLPSGYKRLEYIQSSGTQYIDTGFIPTVKTKVEVEIDFLPTNTSYNCVFGVGETTANQFVVYRNGQNMVGQVYSTTTYSTSGIANTGRNLCVLSNEKFSYGSYSTAITPENYTYTRPMYIFAMNSVGSAALLAFQKLYSFKIYDNETLVRDFAPCQKLDGTVGLWDDVNSLFYGNAGTGTFIAGPEIHEGGIFVKVNGVWKQIDNVTVNVR